MGYREVRAQCRPVVLNQDDFVISPPIQIMSGEVGVCHNWEGGLLASHGQRLGMLLNILWCTQSPHTENRLAPNVDRSGNVK